MNGTIFHRGKKLKDKMIRALAWIRVKKYWLFMPQKEYKHNLFYNLSGMVLWLIAVPVAIYGLVVFKAVPWITDFVNGMTVKEEPKVEETK